MILLMAKIVTKEAYLERAAPLDPLPSAGPMGNNRRRRGAFTESELATLFPEDRGALVKVWGEARWAVAYSLTEGTGVRVGEACVLRWADVDPEAAIVRIARAVTGAMPCRLSFGLLFPSSITELPAQPSWSSVVIDVHGAGGSRRQTAGRNR